MKWGVSFKSDNFHVYPLFSQNDVFKKSWKVEILLQTNLFRGNRRERLLFCAGRSQPTGCLRIRPCFFVCVAVTPSVRLTVDSGSSVHVLDCCIRLLSFPPPSASCDPPNSSKSVLVELPSPSSLWSSPECSLVVCVVAGRFEHFGQLPLKLMSK